MEQIENVSPKSIFYIKKVNYKTAMDMVIKYHYLHRKTPCSFAFGLFTIKDDEIIGIITYGTPSSSSLRQGICGFDERFNVIELTRLWISDTAPKNSESFLIGNTIKLVDKEIIVSYAEIGMGHLGTVYQATNWIYTGLSAKRKIWQVKNINVHSQTMSDRYGKLKDIQERFGDDFYKIERPRKHRYVYFNCDKTKKKKLINLLRYKIEPYPKKNIKW